MLLPKTIPSMVAYEQFTDSNKGLLLKSNVLNVFLFTSEYAPGGITRPPVIFPQVKYFKFGLLWSNNEFSIFPAQSRRSKFVFWLTSNVAIRFPEAYKFFKLTNGLTSKYSTQTVLKGSAKIEELLQFSVSIFIKSSNPLIIGLTIFKLVTLSASVICISPSPFVLTLVCAIRSFFNRVESEVTMGAPFGVTQKSCTTIVPSAGRFIVTLAGENV